MAGVFITGPGAPKILAFWVHDSPKQPTEPCRAGEWLTGRHHRIERLRLRGRPHRGEFAALGCERALPRTELVSLGSPKGDGHTHVCGAGTRVFALVGDSWVFVGKFRRSHNSGCLSKESSWLMGEGPSACVRPERGLRKSSNPPELGRNIPLHMFWQAVTQAGSNPNCIENPPTPLV